MLRGILVSAAAGFCACAALAADRYGFTGPESFPIDYGIAFLKVADLDGDGLNDLIVVNNARSKINLLYNQTGKTNRAAAKTVGRRDINELPPDSRFRVDSLASEKRISSLVVADFNGDGRPDLAYYGDPKELVLVANLGTNGWAAPRRWSIDDGLTDANALAIGDLNGDGRPDLLLLGEKWVYALLSKPGGVLGEPEKIYYTGAVKGLQALDINGDGKDDLLFVNWENANPFRFRLNIAPGQFGLETHLPLAAIRSYTAEDLDGDRVPEIVTIAARSGRAAVSHFVQQAAGPLVGDFKDGQFAALALPRTDKARRGVVWADLDGDGRTDLLFASPDEGELTLELQNPDGQLGAPRSFPTLTGVAELAVADWDGDGRPEIFALSADEKQVGVASLNAAGRVDFPKPLSLSGRPLAMTVGAIRAHEKPRLAVIVEREEKKTNKDGKEETTTYREAQIVGADGKVVSQRLAETYKGSPASLTLVDANQDGLPDLVLLTPYEKIKILVQRQQPGTNGAIFFEADVNAPGGGSDNPWMSYADIEGDGKIQLLLPQKNFVRAVVLGGDEKAGWSFVVRDQINGASGNSRIAAATVLPGAAGKSPVLFLLDADRKALTACVRDSTGVWKAEKSSSLPVTEFNALQPLALASTTPNAIGFVGVNTVAWKRLDGSAWEYSELDGYETPIRNGYLHDVTAGDLNQDGRKDLVFLETGRGYIDLVAFDPPHQLVPSNRWPVFEERSYRPRRSGESPEPREAVIADVTGDKKADLIILVHDRVLLYPQQ